MYLLSQKSCSGSFQQWQFKWAICYGEEDLNVKRLQKSDRSNVMTIAHMVHLGILLVCSNYYVFRKWINYKHIMIHIVYSSICKANWHVCHGSTTCFGNVVLRSSWLLLVLVFIYFDYRFVCCSCSFFSSKPSFYYNMNLNNWIFSNS